MRKCSNPDCTVFNPEFYPGRNKCKECHKAQVTALRQRPEGLAIHRQANARYRAKGKDKKDKLKWRKYNTVCRETLREQYHTDCAHCIENLDGTGSLNCHVANGQESLTLCPVWQEWKQTGIHPLCNIPDEWWDTYPYDPELDVDALTDS